MEGIISGALLADLDKIGGGRLVLGGVSDNATYGMISVSEGVLELAKNMATAIAHGRMVIGDGVGGARADILRVTTAAQIADAVPVTINSSGWLDVTDQDERIGALTLDGGEASSDVARGGTLYLGDDVNVTANSNRIARLNGRVSLPATRTFDVSGHYFSPDLNVGAQVVGAGGITKTGNGE